MRDQERDQAVAGSPEALGDHRRVALADAAGRHQRGHLLLEHREGPRALVRLVRTAGVELKPREVRVNAVAPGLIVTPRVLARPARSEHENDTGSLNQKGAMKDVANAILFLASDMASYITGQTIVVDGGAIVKSPFETGTLAPGFTMRDS